jgi:hypothetical protein
LVNSCGAVRLGASQERFSSMELVEFNDRNV